MKYYNLILYQIDKTYSINEISEDFFNDNLKKEFGGFSSVCYRLNETDLNKFVNDLETVGEYTKEVN